MGKQVRIYATPTDLKYLFENSCLNSLTPIDKYGEPLTFETLFSHLEKDFSEGGAFGECYLTKDGWDIKYLNNDDFNIIDQIKSEVIQFSVCQRIPAKTLDTSSVDDVFRKNGFIVIDDSEKFHRMMEQLLENPVYVENPIYVENGFECGRFWFGTDYYDDTGDLIGKSKELDLFFSSLRRYIRKNYKISEDKAYYIGKDAYELYLKGEFIPCCGKTHIDFTKDI